MTNDLFKLLQAVELLVANTEAGGDPELNSANPDIAELIYCWKTYQGPPYSKTFKMVDVRSDGSLVRFKRTIDLDRHIPQTSESDGGWSDWTYDDKAYHIEGRALPEEYADDPEQVERIVQYLRGLHPVEQP